MPSSRNIAVFQFHDHIDLCKGRIELIRAFNPDVAIVGLFTGARAVYPAAAQLSDLPGVTIVCAVSHEPPWYRKNTDLAIVEWFRSEGSARTFDRVFAIQWDLLLFDALANLSRQVTSQAVVVSGLTPLAAIADFWDWTTAPSLAGESTRLLTLARERFGYDGVPMACIGPGYSLSRSFLEAYASLDLVDVGHDELRLPLFAQILDFPLADSGYYPCWNDPDIERVFNATPIEVSPVDVAAELRRANGRRAFHPCRHQFDDDVVASLAAIVLRA